MARLKAKLQTTGLSVKDCLVNNAGQVWNGSAFVAFSSLANTAAWQAGLVTLTEQALTDATATGVYEADLPAGVPLPVTALSYVGASPAPGDVVHAVQELTDLDLVSTGNVVADGSNSANSFKTDLTGTDADNYIGRLLILISGNGVGEPRRITGFDTGTKFVTLSVALSTVPSDGAAFSILGMIEA